MMTRIIVIVVSAVIIIPGIVSLSGMRFQERRDKAEIERLLLDADRISGRSYDENLLDGLPIPVQQYFKYALEDGQPYICSVNLKHGGEFRADLDKEWISIEGEQHFTSGTPGFFWKGKTALYSVRDQYIEGTGRIEVRFMNLFKLEEGEGPEYDQGELLRWLGESVWFPTNLLPGDHLSWSPVDGKTVRLLFNYGGQDIFYRVSFNAVGEITRLETQRYMGTKGPYTWIGRMSDYERVNGMRIPMKIEACWKLNDVEYPYARFNVNEINHNY